MKPMNHGGKVLVGSLTVLGLIAFVASSNEARNRPTERECMEAIEAETPRSTNIDLRVERAEAMLEVSRILLSAEENVCNHKVVRYEDRYIVVRTK